MKDPYSEFGEALDRFIWACWEAIRVRQIVEWLTKVLERVR